VREALNVGNNHDNAAIIDRNTGRRDVARTVSRRRWERLHHTVNGEVTDVDRNSGKVNIRASDGSKVQVILAPLAVATANKDDRASIDITIGPAR
jgi:hypothetical protein